MKVTMLGCGYVGLVSGSCFAEFGASVTCFDVDKTKVQKLLEGGIPIYEPGLDDLEKADAVILAVPHKEFLDQGWKLISELLQTKGGIAYDIKSTLDRSTTPENINLYRL